MLYCFTYIHTYIYTYIVFDHSNRRDLLFFHVLYKVASIFKSADETLVFDHLYTSRWAVLSWGAVLNSV